MPSDLVAAAIQAAAKRAFKGTAFGRLIGDLSRLGAAGQSLAKLQSKIGSLKNRSLLNASPEVMKLAANVRQAFGSKLSGTVQRELYRVTGLQPIMNAVDAVERYAKGDRKQRKLTKLVKALSHPSTGSRVELQRELEAAVNLLKAFGYNVTPPEITHDPMGALTQPQGTPIETQTLQKKQRQQQKLQTKIPKPPYERKTQDIDLGDTKRRRIKNDDPLLSGEMIRVQSSNVYAIGFVIEDEQYKGGKHGTLLIQFLAQGPNGVRQGPGSLYQYFGVPASLFQKFRKASSKGRFVWDNIRVRGTVSQSRFTYELAGITQGYVPRRAAHRQGVGEMFVRRQFQGIKSMNTVQVNDRKRLKSYKPYKPTLNRGAPNRGKRP